MEYINFSKNIILKGSDPVIIMICQSMQHSIFWEGPSTIEDGSCEDIGVKTFHVW